MAAHRLPVKAPMIIDVAVVLQATIAVADIDFSYKKLSFIIRKKVAFYYALCGMQRCGRVFYVPYIKKPVSILKSLQAYKKKKATEITY